MTTQNVLLTVSDFTNYAITKALQLTELAQQQQAQSSEINVFEDGAFKIVSVSLGTDVRVGSTPALQPPIIINGEIDLDGLNNPYIVLNCNIPTTVLNGADIISFYIYRKKVAAEDLGQQVEAFAKADFDMIGNGATETGQFSADRKAQFQIDSSLAPIVSTNTNLFTLQQVSTAQSISQPSLQVEAGTSIAANLDATFIKIAEVNYAQYQANAQLKQVYVTNTATSSFSYTDVTVQYGAGYQYCVSSYSSNSTESAKSQVVSAVVLDLKPINQPLSLNVKQIIDTEIQITGTVQASDLIKNVYLFKRDSQSASAFELIAANPPSHNGFSFTDSDQLIYGHTYVYRILLENIFGVVSEPIESSILCSGQNVIPKSRSHNLALPIVLATPDSTLDGIKVTVYPNDPKVIYYNLDRRNLTQKEKVFAIPGNPMGDFWQTNQFPVVALSSSSSINSSTLVSASLSNSLLPQSNFLTFANPIQFTDTFIQDQNFYQYRVAGVDIFGNTTSYGFASLAADFVDPLRAPVNLSVEVLRQNPFRVKISWTDDNLMALSEDNNSSEQQYLSLALQALNLNQSQIDYLNDFISASGSANLDLTSALQSYNLTSTQIQNIQNQISNLTVATNTYKFILQRRQYGQSVYEQFPLTQDFYVIDDAPCLDPVPFSTGSRTDTFGSLSSSAQNVSASIVRPFNLPEFLSNEQVYEYRVAVQSLSGAMSPFSDSVSILCSANISQPTNLSASVLNPNFTPVVVHLQWGVDSLQSFPDHWQIERKTTAPTDGYIVVGNAYLSTEYFDRGLQLGTGYMYRITSISVTSVQSEPMEVSVQT